MSTNSVYARSKPHGTTPIRLIELSRNWTTNRKGDFQPAEPGALPSRTVGLLAVTVENLPAMEKHFGSLREAAYAISKLPLPHLSTDSDTAARQVNDLRDQLSTRHLRVALVNPRNVHDLSRAHTPQEHVEAASHAASSPKSDQDETDFASLVTRRNDAEQIAKWNTLRAHLESLSIDFHGLPGRHRANAVTNVVLSVDSALALLERTAAPTPLGDFTVNGHTCTLFSEIISGNTVFGVHAAGDPAAVMVTGRSTRTQAVADATADVRNLDRALRSTL